MLHIIYVGANNETGELNMVDIERVCGLFFKGFTIMEGTGYWEGKSEKTAIIYLHTDIEHTESLIPPLANELRRCLNQDSVLVGQLEAKSKFFVR